MRQVIRLMTVGMLIPVLAAAQERSSAEIGTNLGVTIQRLSGTTVTRIGVPGAGLLGQPTIYATFFAGETIMVEPQLALNVLTSDGSTLTTLGAGAQIGYLVDGPEVNSVFVAATLGFQAVSADGTSDSDSGLGAKVGYRTLAGSSFAVRFEGGFRRWFDARLTEITLGIGIGGVVRRPE